MIQETKLLIALPSMELKEALQINRRPWKPCGIFRTMRLKMILNNFSFALGYEVFISTFLLPCMHLYGIMIPLRRQLLETYLICTLRACYRCYRLAMKDKCRWEC